MSSDFPSSAGTVIIGAGIVGNSLAYHLSKQGRDDILLMDKGPLPDPGGSTGHASNFLMPVEHSKEMTHLTRRSIEQYEDMDTFTNSGGIEVARTDERMAELKRRVQSAKAWGEPGELLSVEEVEEMVPYVNTDIIEGGFYSPGAGTCDPLRAGEVMRARADHETDGGLTVSPNTEVLDLHVEDDAIQAVETDRGTVEAGEVVIAAGLWSPKIAQMAGVEIPLTPAVHQMVSVGPISFFEDYDGEISFPVVRDMDTQMYERQHGNDLEVGSYQHRPILWDVDDVPSIDEAPLSPTQPPLTDDAFEQSMADALEIVPELLDDPQAGVRHEIDGLLSVTPDGAPLLGPLQDVEGLWSCAAVWIKEAPAIGEAVAQWMTRGWSDIDLHGSDVNRFYEYGTSQEFVENRGHEGFQKIYGIVHPAEQWQSSRPLRQSPFYDRQEDLGARFFEAAGWERPQWYSSNEDLVRTYNEELEGLLRGNEWDSRWWSPIILGEHLHMRDHVAMVGDMGFGKFDFVGSDVVEYVEQMAVGRTDVDIGKTVYTPILAENGGFVSDLTIARLGPEHYRVITGGAAAGSDRAWFERHLPEDGDVTMIDRSESLCTLGVWGPDAREVVQSVTEEDMSHEAFPPYTAQEITVGEVDAWAMRLSYVGELGWEIYAPAATGGRLWDTIAAAGEEYDIRPVGMGVYGTTGRMEKGYRLFGHELELEYDPAEAGLTFHGVKEADFIGKEAYAEAIDEENAATLCTLSVDDHTSESGERRFMLGNEPVLDDGEVIVDEEGRESYVTSAGTGPSVGKHLLLAYLPPEHAEEGRQLQVEYMGEQYPVTVEVVGSRPLFDPENDRIRS
ncbi:GcvT family protein [Natronobacterium gregoryi]|uniref:FAD-dependent oxidoreductase n=2 Tax=Natronobacterium gregoryi TaxID=44930 RepID=L0AKT3_NATGS|nr:FAD-dependent oxidoreductase [Natronobacterium gregoryi]AFZ74059.1 glycine cleavage system T protein (aminomethyltransferase) [Natronobacterium gregoryi SP2]ELY70361.1 sacrosine dehydrogenase/glycine cleavage T protein [Natronobacterium gregoryi SP2]PLK20801.1 FAD-dependent oxidoreductase [Natronobacterium gregoryi SP2]SFJ06565.1 dimethylglycine oxidase [Natronobacterium gregoryi]